MTSELARFVGRGWAFPMRTDTAGRIALTTEDTEIPTAIVMVVSTAPGERVMRPDFGCEIWNLLFHPINANTLGLMEQGVRDALNRWEPRIEVEEIRARPNEEDDGRVDITIGYVVKATNDRRNLVYPFYVIPREDES